MSDVFVFGSNLAGRHGKGAALWAKEYWGAVYGQGVGRQGQSYAIPTKDFKIKTLPLKDIKPYVSEFLVYAKNNPKDKFILSEIGCGLAGYSPVDIAPMFEGYTENVILPNSFEEILNGRNT